MKFAILAIRNFKEIYRDPLALGFLIAFPLLFMLLFGAALGGNADASYTVGLVDEDRTVVSGNFVNQVLSDIPLLKISPYESEADATTSFKNGDIRAIIAIPEGFGQEINRSWSGDKPDIVLNITHDESDLAVSGQIINAVYGATRSFAGIEIPVTINTRHINIEVKVSQIDFIAPGIIIFGLLIMVPTSARIMVRDKEQGYMARLLTTPTYPWQFITGYSISLLAIAIFQIIIFILLGMAFGMNMVGNVFLLLLSFS
jgi:ABC-2 type transport system permease protein